MTELIHTWQQKLRGSQRRATSESGERESPNAYFVSTWKRVSSKLWQSSARLAEAVVTRRVRALGQSPGEGRAFVGRALATIQRRENQMLWQGVGVGISGHYTAPPKPMLRQGAGVGRKCRRPNF